MTCEMPMIKDHVTGWDPHIPHAVTQDNETNVQNEESIKLTLLKKLE